jgi:hypothetical protein
VDHGHIRASVSYGAFELGASPNACAPTNSYHHDGKHNVMASAVPIEIFGELACLFRALLLPTDQILRSDFSRTTL